MKKILSFVLILMLTSVSVQAAAYYGFEEGSDGNGAIGSAPTTSGWVKDTAGTVNGTVASVNGFPAYTNAVSDYASGSLALEFGEKKNAVNFGNQAVFQWSENTSKTLEFFIRRDGNGPDGSGTEFIMSKGYTSSGGWQMTFNRSSGALQFTVGTQTASSTLDFTDASWHHVAITHAANSAHYDMYVDYTVEASIDEYASGSVTSAEFSLGKGYGWQDQRVFDGAIDDLRISDTVLSTSEFVPEPATIALLGLGSVWLRKRRKK